MASHSPKIYHYKKKTVPKSSIGMEDLEVGEYYALHTSVKGYDLVHVLKETVDTYKVDSIHVYNGYGQSHPGNTTSTKKKINETVFQQALDLYEKCRNEILSLDFDKRPLDRLSLFSDNEYFYLTYRWHNAVSFGKSKWETLAMMNEYIIDPTWDDIIARNVPVNNTRDIGACYMIDAATYEKVKKMHEILILSLTTLMKACLE